jgi:glucosylceramidase
VETGSVRIASDLPANLPNVAFRTPSGKKVLIVLNESKETQYFNIRYGNRQAPAILAGGCVATYVW